ncbi:hypothetical protein [Rummeliibacillus pycnus]|uniref:hypothetical protein n=1 Tax=Rummeliibacillus pycnus TaxID=101070 RepID=UPI003D2A5AEE
MTNGTYIIKLDKLKKEMYMQINGTFSPEKVDQFVKDYDRNVNSIKPSEYNLRLDCKDLHLVSPELVPLLENCYEMYKKTGFQKVIFEIPNSVVLKMQVSRLARKIGLTNAEFVQI